MSTLAQEAFHCLQFAQRPYGEGVPMWALEGAAAFAGEDFAQGSPLSAAWWDRWIGEPQRPIDQRTYDAAGFFFLLQGAVDPYRYSDAFLAEATEDSIRRRLEGTDVFDRWGSQYATEPAWGAAVHRRRRRRAGDDGRRRTRWRSASTGPASPPPG